VAWVLRGFDLNRFLTIATSADLRFILMVPVVVIVEQVVRGWKWRQLLWPLRSIGSVYLFGAIMAGFLLAILVPFGFGTVARSWLVARREIACYGASLTESLRVSIAPFHKAFRTAIFQGNIHLD
jgi:hypothetical protein